MSSPLKAAILVVSTTAAKDPSTDAAEATLRTVFDQDGGGQWTVTESKIVGDVTTEIQRQIALWTDNTDNAVNLVITTGGTGFAIADQTPEAVSPLLHKQAPGLVHGMLAASLSITPFAMMSRPVAGVRNNTVIITLPGSPKGAKENLQAVIKTLPHACLQAAGANSRALHSGGVKKLEQEAGVTSSTPTHTHNHHHHHHHHSHSHGHSHAHGHGNLVRHPPPPSSPTPSELKSNDPSLGPSRRHRSSPYPMLSVPDALSLVRTHVPAPTTTTLPASPSLIGSVLATSITAPSPVPAFRASIVDGYAVVPPPDGNLQGTFPVVAISHASPSSPLQELQQGQIARITTGAPLPPGASSVIMVEDTAVVSLTDDGKEEKEVSINATNVRSGENVREIGSDIQAGTTILQKGEQISSVGGEIGLLSAVGVLEVQVYKKPTIGVLSTGDEIVEHSKPDPLQHGEVRDTNRPTLISAAQGAGYEVLDLGIVSDKPGSLEETLRSALRQVDLLITTGGVSMGELDLLKPTIERSLGGIIHFGRVNMKPGKPTTFATVPVKSNDGQRVEKVVFSLPGNPASALVTFHLFVLPALHHMSGIEPAGLTTVPVVLSHDFQLDPQRPEYHRAIVSVGKDGVLTATSTGGQRSSKVGSMKGANALLCMPAGKEALKKGDKVEALLMGGIRSDV